MGISGKSGGVKLQGVSPGDLDAAMEAAGVREKRVMELIEGGAANVKLPNLGIAQLAKTAQKDTLKFERRLNKKLRRIDRRIRNPLRQLYAGLDQAAATERMRARGRFGMTDTMGNPQLLASTGPHRSTMTGPAVSAGMAQRAGAAVANTDRQANNAARSPLIVLGAKSAANQVALAEKLAEQRTS